MYDRKFYHVMASLMLTVAGAMVSGAGCTNGKPASEPSPTMEAPDAAKPSQDVATQVSASVAEDSSQATMHSGNAQRLAAEEGRHRIESAIVLLSMKTQPDAAALAAKILADVPTIEALPLEMRRAAKYFRDGRPKTAAKLLSIGKENGSLDARQLLAVCLLHGLGVPIDKKAAHAMLESAGRDGQRRAAGQAGRMYELGVGCTKSLGFAEQMYRLGAEAGDLDSQASLGGLLIRNGSLDEGFEQLLQAANRGSPEAACGAAKCYALGWGTRQNDQRAERWFRVAAEADVGEAQLGLAALFSANSNDPESAKQMVYWLRRAAANGVPKAIELMDHSAASGLDAALAKRHTLDDLRATTDDSSYPSDRDPIAPTLFDGPRTEWEERQWFKADW